MKTWKTNQQVSGMFGGRVQYSGRILDSRWTPDGKGTIFTVFLDSPIDSYGRQLGRVEIIPGQNGDTINPS